LLETIREFAHERLREKWNLQGTLREIASERLKERNDVAATSARHCDYYFGIVKTARAKLQGPEQAEWTRRIEVDLDNCRAAIALALARGVDPVIAVKFEVALHRFRTLRGYSTEGRNNIRAALMLPELQAPNVARGHALYVGGALAARQGDQAEAVKMLDECLAIRRTLGDRLETAGTLSTLTTLYVEMGSLAKAREYQEESLAMFRELGNPVGEAIGLQNLGEISLRQGDPTGARDLFEQCLTIARRVKHQELESECERSLGEIALGAGEAQAAQACFERSLVICKEAEDRRGEAIALWALGRADAARGDLASARKKLSESMRALHAFEMTSELLDCLEDQARLLQLVGQAANAVRAFAAAATLREAFCLARAPYREADRRAGLYAARVALGDSGFDLAWSTGKSWALEEAVDHALAASASEQLIA
jgi:tetratricopeptide (TPR) repeat protein